MHRLFRFRGRSHDKTGHQGNSDVLRFGRYKFRAMSLTLALGLSMIAPAVFAITAPAAGSFAYDVYDIAVTKMLQGPIGFVGGASAMVVGAVMAIQGKLMTAVPAIVGGALLLKADTLVTSLGAII